MKRDRGDISETMRTMRESLPLFESLLVAEATGRVQTAEAFATNAGPNHGGPDARVTTIAAAGGGGSVSPSAGPRIREPAQSVRNDASEAAADSLSADTLERECRRVYVWFAAQAVPRTRHECAAVLYMGADGIANLGSSTGRINALVGNGWLIEVGKQGKRGTLRITTPEERRAALSSKREAA